MVIRFSILMFDGESLMGEYEIAVDIDPYVDYDIGKTNTNINIDAAGIQQHLTTQIAEMQITGLIARGFQELEWDASEEDSDEVSSNNDPEAATGDTIKLSPVLPEGN